MLNMAPFVKYLSLLFLLANASLRHNGNSGAEIPLIASCGRWGKWPLRICANQCEQSMYLVLNGCTNLGCYWWTKVLKSYLTIQELGVHGATP